MRVYEQIMKISKVAVVTLLLIFAVTATQAQTWPKPTTPPTPATIPAIQTVHVGFEELGFIEYASVDALCAPAPGVTLDTTAGVSSPAATPTPTPAAPTPAACKTAGGWIQINNDTIRIPQN